jgi:hypothetical protein
MNALHSDLPFYANIDVAAEDRRLKSKIQSMQSVGLSITDSPISIDRICELVCGKQACVVLVDCRFLPHASLFLSMQPSYVGHFVLAVSETLPLLTTVASMVLVAVCIFV